MFVSDLIKKIPVDTKRRVSEANQRYNKTIREVVRSVTRLNLNAPEQVGHKIRGRQGVSVSVDSIGYPKDFEEKSIPNDLTLSALLSLRKTQLLKLRDSTNSIGRLLQKPKNSVERETQDLIFKLHPKVGSLAPSLGESFEVSEILLKESGRYDLIGELFKLIDEDILGHYFYKLPKGDSTQIPLLEQELPPTSSRIVLYWGVIGLVAEVLNLSVEDLTVVVMAHELAHAYTHLGFDIDGYYWNTYSFYKSDRALVEGLAQYYTEKALKILSVKIPGGYGAYEELLRNQPSAYHTHNKWIKDTTPEAVRTALITMRKKNPIALNKFNDKLQTIGIQYK